MIRNMTHHHKRGLPVKGKNMCTKHFELNRHLKVEGRKLLDSFMHTPFQVS